MSEQSVLSEIIQGYSKIGDSFFFKHPSIADRIDIACFEDHLTKWGREQLNLKTKDENIAEAIEQGKWSKDKEEEIDILKWEVKKYKGQVDALQDPSIKAEFQDKLNKSLLALDELQRERRTYEGIHLEGYVYSRLPSDLCSREVYEDSSFSIPISPESVSKISKEYLEKNASLSDRDSLLKAVFIPSFFDLFFIYDSIDNILGKNIYQMTSFQKELIGYGKVLHSKLTRMLDIPDGIKGDPIKLYLYEDKKDKKEEVETNIRKDVERIGGLENMKPEHKIT